MDALLFFFFSLFPAKVREKQGYPLMSAAEFTLVTHTHTHTQKKN